jgi:hypothetical protein
MRGYKAMSLWAQDLGQKARARFRYRNPRYEVPSRSVLREVLTRVDPGALERALQGWNAQHAAADEGLAIHGQTMCNALDEEGRQSHILGGVGHQSQRCYAPKKSLPCPGADEVKQTNEIGMVIPLLESLDITGKTLSTDALRTQRKLADSLIDHHADYLFTVKDNQPTLHEDSRPIFQGRARPEVCKPLTLAHGRIEQRSIWTTTRL